MSAVMVPGGALAPAVVPMVRLFVDIAARAETPRDQRWQFANAERIAIVRALAAGSIDQDVAEELWRTVTDPERA